MKKIIWSLSVLVKLMIKNETYGSVCVGHMDAIVYIRWLSFGMKK